MDNIILKGMKFFAYHGVTEEEQTRGQNFIVDIIMSVDAAPAARGDSLDLTVDYDAVYKLTAEIVNGSKVRLIETLASRIAEAVLLLPLIESVTVRIKKPEPPIAGELKWAGVEITRY